MANKADVKAIMARFQTAGTSVDETSSSPAGCPKQPLHPTLSSGPPIQKKPVLESLSGSAANTPPKPSFLKNAASTTSNPDVHAPNKTKALTSKFANNQDDTSAGNKPFVIKKQQTPLKPNFSHATEAKSPVQKSPLTKPSLSSTLSESKPAFPKPPVVNSKPSWVKEDSGGGTALTSSPIPPKAPSLHKKPVSSVLKIQQQNEEHAEGNTDTMNKPSPLANANFKPSSNFKTAQSMFNKEKEPSEQTESGGVNKPALNATNSTAPPKPPANKKPSLKKPHKASTQAVKTDDTSGPKRNPLPNSLALGPAPAKPNRPPKVNLENIKRGAEASEEGPGFKKPTVPAPPSSHPSNQSNHVAPTQPSVVPSLPPRHPGTMNQQDIYDDVDEIINAPPPLPPSAGHPSHKAKEEIDSDDGDMYEPLDDRWDDAEKAQDKKKDDKEEKKRLEAEKKEQKEREKKENDARKRFKLLGPLEVIQQGKALVDCKGSKTDLALKQGDCVDIIRVQGNPEGKWLGRTPDGSIGYVKTTSVEIDFNSLKNRPVQSTNDQELYDDIDVAPEKSGLKGPGVVLPPLPGEDGEIYDDVVDPNLEVRVPPPTQFTADGNSDHPKAADDEEIYDDVDSQNAPPPPPLSSLPGIKGKSKTEEMDPKKQKKFEKEEKDFRKKFKYEGEIQMLYQVNVLPTFSNKKWGGKDLPLKAGETLDVIVKAVDDKLICRNEDGKFGYVLTSNIVMDDGEIYDDIGGDDCIYDND
ncbi:FYN-binding protein 1 isoform X2 [Melanotaenia boesemani]|uniref:FYN-binding protein 1 isoform X2 n=1 Tax=Melanotaenia boesemani TaxID=1250792 RepID=UPI001C03B252|nr:FYN-binding protein 1 isoform X2 [Melanotaenia boesemani]